MYQGVFGFASNESLVISNEISITNLIAIANNPVLFNALDQDTQNKLIKIVCGYTKACISSIMESNTSEAERIRVNSR